MPTYEYRCPQGHDFELFQKMTDKPRAKCPTCGKMAERKISAGAGLVFKGSGFYITDYGKDGKGPRKESASSSPSSTESGSTGKDASAESKPAPAAEKSDKPKKSAAKKAKE